MGGSGGGGRAGLQKSWGLTTKATEPQTGGHVTVEGAPETMESRPLKDFTITKAYRV